MVVQKTACASAPGYSDGVKTGMMVVAGSGIVMAIKMWYYNGSGSVITMELKWYDGGFCEWYIVIEVIEIL